VHGPQHRRADGPARGRRYHGRGARHRQGWVLPTGGGTVQAVSAEAGHPGICRRNCTATAGAVGQLVLKTAAGSSAAAPSAADTWDMTWIVRPTQTADTDVRYGFSANWANNPASDGIYFERLAADTNWFAVCRAGSVETRTDLGVALTAAQWYRLRLRRKDASTIGFSVDGGAETNIATNVPTATMSVGNHISNNAVAADKTHDIDFFSLLMTGASR
jgi:hypothetical protein